MKYTFLTISLFFIFLKSTSHAQVSGTVTLSGKQETTKPAKRGPYGRSASSISDRGKENTGIVVYIASESARDQNLAQSEPQTLNQKDIQFSPRLIVVYKNQKVRVLNSDPVYHNVFSLSSIKSFDIGRRQQGEHKDVIFDVAGIVQVFCDIHSHMNAEIVVLDENISDYKILADGDEFNFDVKEGSYTLFAYASGYDLFSQKIVVTDAKSTPISIRLNP